MCQGGVVVENGLPEGFEEFAWRDDGERSRVTNRFLLEVPGVPSDEVIDVAQECCGQDRGVVVVDECLDSFDGRVRRVGDDVRCKLCEEGPVFRHDGGQFVCQVPIRLDEHLARYHGLNYVRFTETQYLVGGSCR